MGEQIDRGRVLTEIYPELRRIAGAMFRKERPGNTFTASEIIQSAIVKLLASKTEFNSTRHLKATAVIAMRRVILDHIERRKAEQRRREKWWNVRLTQVDPSQDAPTFAFEDVSAIMDRLEAMDPVAADIAQLMIFLGMKPDQLAEELGLPRQAVQTIWKRTVNQIRDELSRLTPVESPRRRPPGTRTP